MDIAVLLQKRFVLGFESGVIVIKHWRINNYLQGDRCKPTTYIEELNTLSLDNKKAYIEKDRKTSDVYNLYTDCIHSIEKSSVNKCSGIKEGSRDSGGLGEKETRTDSAGEADDGSLCETSLPREKKNTKSGKTGYGAYGNVSLSQGELEKLKAEFPSDWQQRIENLSAYIASTGKRYKNHLATIRNWARMDRERGRNLGYGKQQKPADNRSFSDNDVKAYEEWGRRKLKEAAEV